jgi:hypothetical protein
LKALFERKVSDAVRQARELIGEVQEPNFEFEAACNLLAVLVRLDKHELQLEGLDHDVQVLARRFAVSRTTCELLVKAAQERAPFERIIRDAYARICAESEDAVSKTVGGAPSEAVRMLLGLAESSFNAKLIDLAMHTLERHRDRIEDAEALAARAQSLHTQYRGYGTQVHLSRANEPRTMTAVAKG